MYIFFVNSLQFNRLSCLQVHLEEKITFISFSKRNPPSTKQQILFVASAGMEVCCSHLYTFSPLHQSSFIGSEVRGLEQRGHMLDSDILAPLFCFYGSGSDAVTDGCRGED